MDDFFGSMRKWTQARIGLKRAGISLSTSEVLQFKQSHAMARDAVHTLWDPSVLRNELSRQNISSLIVQSRISSRMEYLKRPDLGRNLNEKSKLDLIERFSQSELDVVFVVSDGLSASAISKHFLPFWEVLNQKLKNFDWRMVPIILAPFSRVAIADEIGEIVKAKVSVMIIGERPGLSSVDSLGVYLTYAPQKGKQDSQRNCISNIRPPDGLSYEQASNTLLFLMDESIRLKLSGVDLKDESGTAIESG